MRPHIYLLAMVAAASFATASAQNAQNQGTPNRRPPPAPQAVPPANTTVVPPNTTVVPPNTTVAPPNTTVAPANTTVVPPNTTPQPSNPATNSNVRNPNVQQRVPPAARGVGAANRPNCSTMKGLEKAECERRDTSRDDLPAGVTTTQPKNPPQ